MKHLLLFLLISTQFLGAALSQDNENPATGFGYMLDIGGKSNFKIGQGYNQSMTSIQHNFFYRVHSLNKFKATQFQISFRTDSINFTNNSSYLASDGVSIKSYNNKAYLTRKAMKLGVLQQIQFGEKPGNFIFALNYGLFYEFTTQTRRYGLSDEYSYRLNSEINKHNLIGTVGAELRIR